jgi:hypothetical protein
MKLSTAASLLVCCLLSCSAGAAEFAVSIRADFPGGNVSVLQNAGATVQVTPDLRGGQPWFYWHFEATATQPGRVTFQFPAAQRIGVRGPAVSLDSGKSWRWLGTDNVVFAAPPGNGEASKRESFAYDFTAEHLQVRFAVAIPYLQENLDKFLQTHAANKYLQKLPFAKTRNGTPVELLQIGEPEAAVQAVIVTARHHACESMASYVLEGWLQEAMSDSPLGTEFRRKYVLFAIPLVDKAGDQGKNRAPHDHNRDYGESPLYSEIKAIQDLAEAQRVQFALDLHCPALRGDIHEAFHFLGLGLPHIRRNVDELCAWLKEERPPIAMVPLNLLNDPQKPNAIDRRINSHHFALRAGARMAATLEIPYAQPGCPLDADLARSYGRSLLRAWVRTKFLAAEAAGNHEPELNAEFQLFRSTFLKTYRSQPAEAEKVAQTYLDAPETPHVYRSEAHNLLALLRLHEKKYAAALEHSDKVASDSQATTHQRVTAALQRLQMIALDPQASPQQVESALRAFQELPYPAAEQQAKAFETASIYYQTKQEYAAAIKLAQQQRVMAAAWQKGRILLRIAMLHELLEQSEPAVAAREEAVRLLREQLAPKPPRSAFGAAMVVDLFDAVCSLPALTLAEKQAAAQQVLDHEIVAAGIKEQVRKKLAAISE